MADITKCDGSKCSIKESCYRFTAKASNYQSYFAESPIKDGECEMYWGKQNEFTIKEIKDILNGKLTPKPKP